MSNDAIIIAVCSGAGVLIAACVTAWINLKKNRSDLGKIKDESEKAKRDDVLEEWQVITTRLQVTVKEQDVEIKALRGEVIKLYSEISALRVQIVARETERVEQRGEIRALEKKVIEVKKPDAEAIAQAIVPKLAEAMVTSGAQVMQVTPMPVTIVPTLGAEPQPVTISDPEKKKE